MRPVPARGRTGAATAQARALDHFAVNDRPADRFTRVVEMLDRLIEDGAIASNVEVAPPRTQAARRLCRAAPHGALAVWAFPKIPFMAAVWIERSNMRSFRHRPPSYADVRRTAMVRSIVVDETVVYWIEIEPRGPGDYHRSLVFRQGGTLHLPAVVTSLLDLAAGKRGSWPSPAAFPGLLSGDGSPSVARAALWDHRRAGVPAATVVGDAAADAYYIREIALVAIREAAG